MLSTSFSREIKFTLDGVRIALEVRVYDDGRFSVVGTFDSSLGQCADRIEAFYDESSAIVQPLADVLAAWQTFHLEPIPADEFEAVKAALDALDGEDFGEAPDLDALNDLHGDRIDSHDVIANVEIYRAWARSKGYDLSISLDAPNAPEIADDDVDTFEAARKVIALNDDGESYASDWAYGETMISDDSFRDYAEEFADDVGAIDKTARWPLCHIDWDAAAESLKADYTAIEFDGRTYWVR